jgi:CBS domain-containing protein
MVRNDVGRLVVVSRSDPKKVTGFITRSDILGAHIRRLRESEPKRSLPLKQFLRRV